VFPLRPVRWAAASGLRERPGMSPEGVTLDLAGQMSFRWPASLYRQTDP
jgi:hypothetical protein